MSQAMTVFIDFLHRNKNNPKVILYCEKLFNIAHAMHEAESVGLILDPDSVEEACERILEGLWD